MYIIYTRVYTASGGASSHRHRRRTGQPTGTNEAISSSAHCMDNERDTHTHTQYVI